MGLKSGGSQASSAWAAVAELHDQISGPRVGFVVVFCSPRYDHDELLAALRRYFGKTPVFGCTTAGEITPFGYISGGISGVSFPEDEFDFAATLYEGLSRFEIAPTLVQTNALIGELAAARADSNGAGQGTTFGLLLIDGLSAREELLVSAIGNILTGTPLVGGSAGDDLNFRRSYVLYQGHFHTDAALLLLIHTSRRCSVFKTEHFVPTDRKMVVTGAHVERRRVYELNAEPAAIEYARVLGLANNPLSPQIFAANPVVVRVGGQYHVRSIQRVNSDNSLTFFCAIDEGLVLTIAQGVDILDNLRDLFERLEREVGPPELIIGCDCVLRNLELEEKSLKSAVSSLFVEHRVVGFCTYGEQYMSMHVNQTFTGVAIGAP